MDTVTAEACSRYRPASTRRIELNFMVISERGYFRNLNTMILD
jgi:hypothetical protein